MSSGQAAGKTRWRGPGALLAVFAIAIAIPAQAFAEAGDPTSDPTAAMYYPPGKQGAALGVSDESKPGDVAGVAAASVPVESAAESPGGTLPLTGFDAVALLAVAIALAGSGLALRRLTARRG